MCKQQDVSDTSKFGTTVDKPPDSRPEDRDKVVGRTSGSGTNSSVARVVKLGYTSLHDAARDNASEAVTALLENGADVNAKDKYGYPALHWAAWHNASEAAVVLLENGADANAKNDKDFTPLHWSAWNNGHETAVVLLENGADVNVKNEDGDTPAPLGQHGTMSMRWKGQHWKTKRKSIRGINLVIPSCIGQRGVTLMKQRLPYSEGVLMPTRRTIKVIPPCTLRRRMILPK